MPCLLLQICHSVCFVICLLMCLVDSTVAPADEIQLPGDKRFPIIGTIRCSFWPRSVAYSPDGKMIAACGRPNNSAFLWNGKSLEAISELAGHSDNVNAVAFSPDSKLLATASDDRTVRIWEIETGQLVVSLTGHENSVECLSFSSDGKWLATASRDSTTRIWNLGTRQSTSSFDRGTNRGAVKSRFHPDTKSVATIADSRIICWEPNTTNPPILVLNGPYEHKAERINENFQRRDAIYDLCLSSDGKSIAAGGLDKTLVCWTYPKGDEKFRVSIGSSISAINFSPDSKLLATNGPNQSVLVLEAATGQQLATLRGLKAHALCIGFSPDGKTLVAGGGEAGLMLWDIRAEAGR